MEITEQSNEKAMKKLEQGIDKCWDLFLYGDKKLGIKPGRVETYGAIAGQREVLEGRKKLREELNQKEE